MKKKIIIIDCGGNLRSVEKRVNLLGFNAIISKNPKTVSSADKLILPGVGHFSNAMKNLKKAGIINVLNKKVIAERTPILGICLGMQLMSEYSQEGNVKGLGWFDAHVIKFEISDKIKFKVPHIGWNNIIIRKKSALFDGISNRQIFYFVHSFFVKCNNNKDILSTTEYEYQFTSSIQKDNIYGTQFHPEKSHDPGEKILKNFLTL